MKATILALVMLLGMVFVVNADPQWVEGELIVKFKSDTNQKMIDDVNRKFGALM